MSEVWHSGRSHTLLKMNVWIYWPAAAKQLFSVVSICCSRITLLHHYISKTEIFIAPSSGQLW